LAYRLARGGIFCGLSSRVRRSTAWGRFV